MARTPVRLQWNTRPVVQASRQALQAALMDTAKEVFDESQKLVPRDSDQLADSGGIIENPDNPLEVVISYGDDQTLNGNDRPASEYAARQHEDMSLKHPNGGEAKFLEKPLNAAEERFQANLARRLREAHQ